MSKPVEMRGPNGARVFVPESRAEKLSVVLGYKYIIPDESPLEAVSEPVTPKPPRKPRAPRKTL